MQTIKQMLYKLTVVLVLVDGFAQNNCYHQNNMEMVLMLKDYLQKIGDNSPSFDIFNNSCYTFKTGRQRLNATIVYFGGKDRKLTNVIDMEKASIEFMTTRTTFKEEGYLAICKTGSRIPLVNDPIALADSLDIRTVNGTRYIYIGPNRHRVVSVSVTDANRVFSSQPELKIDVPDIGDGRKEKVFIKTKKFSPPNKKDPANLMSCLTIRFEQVLKNPEVDEASEAKLGTSMDSLEQPLSIQKQKVLPSYLDYPRRQNPYQPYRIHNQKVLDLDLDYPRRQNLYQPYDIPNQKLMPPRPYYPRRNNPHQPHGQFLNPNIYKGNNPGYRFKGYLI